MPLTKGQAMSTTARVPKLVRLAPWSDLWPPLLANMNFGARKFMIHIKNQGRSSPPPTSQLRQLFLNIQMKACNFFGNLTREREEKSIFNLKKDEYLLESVCQSSLSTYLWRYRPLIVEKSVFTFSVRFGQVIFETRKKEITLI